jgi:hypothetical protein
MLPHGFKVQGGMSITPPIFAGREEQLGFCAQVVVDNGHSGGRRRLCVGAGVQLYRQDLEETAKTLQIKLKIKPRSDLSRLGQQLTPGTPAILLFLEG